MTINPKIGILLTNIGTPDHPTPAAVRDYLKAFLSDRRVIEIPRIIWLPLLYGWILPFRAKKSAALYQEIWTEQGSPLLVYSQQLALALETKLNMPVALGMHYSQPSIASALNKLKEKNVQKILVLPLYPQYSATTTAATFDCVARAVKNWRAIPDIHFLSDYADHPVYIKTLAQRIRSAQIKHKPQQLIFSFHGIPKRFVIAGDPYEERCRMTVALLAKELSLQSTDYQLTFQSRLGRAEWLQPYTDTVLQTLPQQNMTDIQVVCPGFAVDCLETLEEIALRGKKQFLASGGKQFEYIPALNASSEHVEMLAELISSHYVA